MDNVDLRSSHAELEFYRQNQACVEQELRTVIADNQRLSQRVNVLLHEKLLNASCTQGAEASELRAQLAALVKERDSLHVLWQTSQATVHALETELKTYQIYDRNSKSKDHQHPNHNLKDLELKLETSLSDYLELESKHKELTNKLTSLQNELDSKEKEITSYKERGKHFEEQIESLNKVLEESRINLATERKSHEEFKSQLRLCQSESVDLVKKEAEAKFKVSEALQLFDVVAAQKNEADMKIAAITEELIMTQKSLESVNRATEHAISRELDETRRRYNERLADMLAHMRSLDRELVDKGLLLNTALREVKVLRSVNESLVKERADLANTTDPQLARAQEKLHTVIQELVSSERRNIQLVAEQQSLALDMRRTQDTHTRELKRRDWEHTLLNTRCEELKLQVEHLSQSLEDTHGVVDRLQQAMTSRNELTLKMVSSKEEALLELNHHLEKQMELSKKWKESYVEMTEKLQGQLQNVERENKELRHRLRLPSIGPSSGDDSA